MPVEDLNYASLAGIRTRVRELTSSPSQNQLTDDKIDYYINIFVLYSFPEDIKLFNLKKTIRFYTSPYVDTYSTNLTNADDPLYNFKNRYNFTGEPCFINGVRSFFTQDRSQFFRQYPALLKTETIGYNSGSGYFAGTLGNPPVLQNNIVFTSVDSNGLGVALKDIPQTDPTSGKTLLTGDLVTPNELVSRGSINYQTGAYTISINAALNAKVECQYASHNPSMPLMVLFFGGDFTLRPVPDKVYTIDLEVYARPSQLIDDNDMPELSQHWEYIAYGAAKKIFESRRDPEGKAGIMDAFKELEEQVRTKSTMQLSEQRASTIYEDKGYYGNWNVPFGWRY